MDVVHDACLHFTTQHFLRLSHHPSFLFLPLPLLKEALDPGNVECDSRGMIEALERWIEYRVGVEGVRGEAMEARRSELRVCLFPPSTLFNQVEKRKVMVGDTALFTRLGWMSPQMR